MFALEAFIVERAKSHPHCHSGRKPSCISSAAENFLRRTRGCGIHMQQDYDVLALRLTQTLVPCSPHCLFSISKALIFVTETVCCAPQGRQSRACVGQRALRAVAAFPEKAARLKLLKVQLQLKRHEICPQNIESRIK